MRLCHVSKGGDLRLVQDHRAHHTAGPTTWGSSGPSEAHCYSVVGNVLYSPTLLLPFPSLLQICSTQTRSHFYNYTRIILDFKFSSKKFQPIALLFTEDWFPGKGGWERGAVRPKPSLPFPWPNADSGSSFSLGCTASGLNPGLRAEA